jgi:cytoskeletal protein RodZ
LPEPRSTGNGRRSRGTLLVSFVLLIGFGVALFVVALLLQSGRPDVGARRAAPAPSPAPPPVEPRATPETTAAKPEAPVTPPVVPPEPAPPQRAETVAPLAVPVKPPVPPPAAAPRAQEAKPAPAAEPRPATDASRPAATGVGEPPPLKLGSIASPYRLVARTSESTWLRVRTADGRATEETIPAGEVREWISNRPFVVTIGNAAGVALELNGQKLPPLGGHGVVITRLTLPPAEP